MTADEKKNFRIMGFEFAFGVMGLICLWAAGSLAFSAFGSLTWDRWRATDATDADWRHRSGLRIYTDHGTGCQYISAGGSLTARLGTDQRQICGKAG